MSGDPNFDVDVLVIGAGMAGMTAARALAERNVRVCVIEARERVGGRVLSQTVEGGGVVELGAEFVHGQPPELWALIDETGVRTVERDGSMLREEDGHVVEDDGSGALLASLEELEDWQGEDMAFADWLKASDVPMVDRAALMGFVEGFNAADAGRISAKSLGIQQRAEDATEGDSSWHVMGGYQQLAEYLSARAKELGVEVRLECEAQSITWSEGRAAVQTSQGEMVAKRCIVTVPLGVLQQTNREGGLRMSPEPAFVAQARRMAMGHAARFTLVFRERWWEHSKVAEKEALERMSFLFTSQRMPPVWWTSSPERETLPTLTGWVGGPRSAMLEGMGAVELGRQACVALAEVFKISEAVVRTQLVSAHTHDWAGDRYSLGSYSYVPVGATDASAAMCRPEASTLFCAGEHTDVSGHWGTVHAAIRSGLRVVKQVLGEDVSQPGWMA